MASETLIPRSQVKQEHTWNAESVFADRDAWRAEAAAIAGDIPGLARFAGTLGSGPAALADWLETSAELFRRADTLYMYAAVSSAVDAADQQATAMSGEAGGLYARLAAAAAFAGPEMLALGKDRIMPWVQQEPRLKVYRHFFENLFRQQAHVRSGEVEELLGMVEDPFNEMSRIAGMLTSADMKFPPAVTAGGEQRPIAQSTIGARMESRDRDERRTTYEHYNDTYLSLKNTLASAYLASVKRNIFRARARRHESTLEAVLFPYNIPTGVFHNLIATFRRNLPTWGRYWAVRRKALGVDALQPYDIWAPIAAGEPAVSFEQSVDWICAGLGPLGDTYVQVLRRGCLEERWVDIYPNEGKRQGAFSSGSPGTHPFIMMSHNDTLRGMSTLAHELGHSMHSYLTWRSQPLVYSDYSMFVAEVASNFNQAMTRAYLFEANDDRDFQITLIEEAMANFHRYFFIMPTLARFELEVHTRVESGKSLTADDMNALMADLFSEGYGSEMQHDRARTGITWATFGHLYVPFYTFQYATGIAAAHALSDRVRNGGPAAAGDYLAFLKAGSSLDPIDALKVAGVDMSTPEAVEKTFAIMADMIERLDTLANG